MARLDVHFEVFLKKHQKADWALVEAIDGRQDAIQRAQTLLAQNPRGSVRVSREAFDPESRTFSSATIFESGAEKYRRETPKTAKAELPCLTPDDLYKPAARETVRRALSGWLERREVTPLELLHRVDLVEELDGSENDLQHAVQKIAVARASGSDAPVHDYVKLLNALVEKGIEKARKGARAKTRDKTTGFAELTTKILSEGGPEKRLRSAIAERLSGASSIGEKAGMLLDLHDDLPADPEAAAFAAAQTDAFLAEALTYDHAMRHVFGQARDLGDEVERMTTVYEARPSAQGMRVLPETGRRLVEKFSRKALPDSRSAVAQRILAALSKPKRFRPDSVVEEIKLARQLAQRLIAQSGTNFHPDSLVEVFTLRSARLLSPETMEEAIADAGDPAEQLDRLLSMEDNIVGEANKTKLAGYVRSRLKAQPTERWFVSGPGKPMERLGRLSALQARAMKGGYAAADKAEMAHDFDALGLAVLDETKIFDRVAKSDRPGLDRATALLTLAAQGLVPAGRCTEDAKARAMRLVASEMGRSEAGATGAKPKLAEIQMLMSRLAPPAPEADDDAGGDQAADGEAGGETGESAA